VEKYSENNGSHRDVRGGGLPLTKSNGHKPLTNKIKLGQAQWLGSVIITTRELEIGGMVVQGPLGQGVAGEVMWRHISWEWWYPSRIPSTREL
jgi:hypothetical protein